jgi:phage major head subunit gpT-like protein
MPATSVNFGDLLEPGLRKIFDEQYREIPGLVESIYSMQKSTTSYEKDSAVGGFSDFDDFGATGRLSYDEIYQQYDTTYTHKEWTKAFSIERKLYDDDLYSIINKKPRGMAIAARRTREKHGASLFNNAFTGSPAASGQTGMDGLSLCNAAHTSATPGVATQSNTGTTALSATAVEATRRLMTAYKDDQGELIAVNPDLLLVPRSLEETAWEIIASKGKPDTANNNANFHYGKYQLAVWDYLSDSNNWFFIDSLMASQFLNWFDRVALEFNKDKDFDTLKARFSAYMRYSFGHSDWRFIYGHNVT